jgi:hypothetical protein
MAQRSPRRAPQWIAPLLIAWGAGAWEVGRADDHHLRDTSTPTATCLSCHPFSRSHPVDVDYAQAVRPGGNDLREIGEVIRRGLFLPGGRLVCHTCHDADSRWKEKIVIPPGSRVSDMVIPGDPRTYDPAVRPPSRVLTVEDARVLLPVGYALSPKPLCLACHALD